VTLPGSIAEAAALLDALLAGAAEGDGQRAASLVDSLIHMDLGRFDELIQRPSACLQA
jgi:hypothetical protein